MDFQPLIQSGIELLGAALLAVGTLFAAWLTAWARSKTKLVTAEHEVIVRGYVENALKMGIDYAHKEAAKLDVKIDSTGNALVDIAAKYVLESVPDGLAKLGVTPEQVKKLVAARMVDVLAKLPQAPAPTDKLLA